MPQTPHEAIPPFPHTPCTSTPTRFVRLLCAHLAQKKLRWFLRNESRCFRSKLFAVAQTQNSVSLTLWFSIAFSMWRNTCQDIHPPIHPREWISAEWSVGSDGERCHNRKPKLILHRLVGQEASHSYRMLVHKILPQSCEHKSQQGSVVQDTGFGALGPRTTNHSSLNR